MTLGKQQTISEASCFWGRYSASLCFSEQLKIPNAEDKMKYVEGVDSTLVFVNFSDQNFVRRQWLNGLSEVLFLTSKRRTFTFTSYKLTRLYKRSI